MKWSWSSNEDSALDYLPHRAQVLYLRVLRRRMDFDTCIVGLTARLSYQMIAEWLEERPPARSKNPVVRPSVGEIRAGLSCLERAGLIERVLSDGEVLPLVFFLPLANTGLVRKKYEQQQNLGRTTAKSVADDLLIMELFSSTNSISSDGFMAVDKCENSDSKKGMSNSKISYEQQTSGMSSLSLNNNITARVKGNGYTIADDWLPGVDVVRRIVDEFILPPRFIHQKAVEFKFFWREQNIIAMNWDMYFYGACKNKINERDGEFLTAQKNNHRGGSCGSTRQ